MNTSSSMTWLIVKTAAQRGLNQWRLGLLWIFATLIPTLILAVPAGSMLAEALDHSIFAGEWAQRWNLTVVFELMENYPQFAPALLGAAVVSGLVTLLMWPLQSAMIVSIAQAQQPLGFVALLQGGVRAYGRMLRMLLWSMIPYGIAGAIGYAALKLVKKLGRNAILASTTEHQHAAAMILLILLLVLAHVTVEAGRAQLAVDPARRSAVKAWWRGVKLVRARPLATFGSYLLLTAAGLVIMALLGVLRINLPGASLIGIVVALGITQLIVMGVVWMRSSRLFALMQISAEYARRVHAATSS
jgi:hypothetical protein